MSVVVKFLINLDKSEYHTIIAQLKSTQFEVDSLTHMDEKAPISSQLICSKRFEEWPQVFIEQNNLHNITGIHRIIVFNHEMTNVKPKWYRHWIFPLLISMGVTMGSSFLLVNRVKPDASLYEYLLLTIIPPILALGSGIVIKTKS